MLKYNTNIQKLLFYRVSYFNSNRTIVDKEFNDTMLNTKSKKKTNWKLRNHITKSK